MGLPHSGGMKPDTHTSIPQSPRTLSTRLHREWQRLRRRPGALEQAGSWGLLDGPVTDLDDVLAAVGFETPSTHATEQAFRALVHAAAEDDLAARVTVQRLLPAILSLARKRRGLGDTTDDIGELLGVAWIVIRTYNPARRPGCLAAALVSDIDYRTFRASRRRHSFNLRPIDDSPEMAEPHQSAHASEELLELISRAIELELADDDDVALVGHLLREARANDIAAQLGVTPRTYRNRRDRLTARLREVALAA